MSGTKFWSCFLSNLPTGVWNKFSVNGFPSQLLAQWVISSLRPVSSAAHCRVYFKEQRSPLNSNFSSTSKEPSPPPVNCDAHWKKRRHSFFCVALSPPYKPTGGSRIVRNRHIHRAKFFALTKPFSTAETGVWFLYDFELSGNSDCPYSD